MRKRKKNIEKAITYIEEAQGVYTFKFNEKRKREERPYVAKLVSKRIKKGFYELDRIFEMFVSVRIGEYIEVSGTFRANENDILEIRDSNKRKIYIVRDGDLLMLCSPDDTNNMLAIKQALKGDFGFDNLIEYITGNVDSGDILDELKD
ncbi:hypothetical protein QEW_4406 [Clostridioides difficile CD160]|nr:hypothetical protein QEW_4406 [Clostridioides difficile CD160]